MSTIDASDSLSLQDYFSTTGSPGISASDTVLTLSTVPTASEGFLVLELGTANQEIIYYNSKTSSTVTCPSVARGRGQGGTTAVGHTSGYSVKQVVNADYLKELQNGNTNTGLHTWFDEGFYDYVQTGCVITGDSYAVNKNFSMTSGVVYLNGKRLAVAAVTAHTVGASKDCYVDITLTTGSNAGTVVFTEVNNNAASPALAANSVRIGIVVAGATTIAAAGSINQGDPACVLPIASSVAYSVTDSLGNLICNRTPYPTLIGYKQILAPVTTTSTTTVAVTGLSCPVIVPTNRRVKITVYSRAFNNNSGNQGLLDVLDGSTVIGEGVSGINAATHNETALTVVAYGYTSGSKTYNANFLGVSSGTVTFSAGATTPGYISVELV